MNRPQRKRSDAYIMTIEDGGAQYIELWCYRQSEAELEAAKLKIHNLESQASGLAAEVRRLQALSASQEEALQAMERGRIR